MIQSGEEEEIRKGSVSLFFRQDADDDFSGALIIEGSSCPNAILPLISNNWAITHPPFGQ